jgi:hypothetical protein
MVEAGEKTGNKQAEWRAKASAGADAALNRSVMGLR